jgi:hypothetical protein
MRAARSAAARNSESPEALPGARAIAGPQSSAPRCRAVSDQDRQAQHVGDEGHRHPQHAGREEQQRPRSPAPSRAGGCSPGLPPRWVRPRPRPRVPCWRPTDISWDVGIRRGTPSREGQPQADAGWQSCHGGAGHQRRHEAGAQPEAGEQVRPVGHGPSQVLGMCCLPAPRPGSGAAPAFSGRLRDRFSGRSGGILRHSSGRGCPAFGRHLICGDVSRCWKDVHRACPSSQGVP